MAVLFLSVSHPSHLSSFAPGRLNSLVDVTPHPEDPETTYELQLKGAGRTPFSRSADGLAVLPSSIREYPCSEGDIPPAWHH